MARRTKNKHGKFEAVADFRVSDKRGIHMGASKKFSYLSHQKKSEIQKRKIKILVSSQVVSGICNFEVLSSKT